MKRLFLTSVAILGTLSIGRAALFIQGTTGQTGTTEGTVGSSIIYDGNPAYITANTMDLTSAGLGPALSGLTVTLNLSGGMNNGLYAWLVAPGGTTVVLMHQPGVAANGFGAMGAGMNITLQDAFTTQGSIQDTTSGAVLSGAYNPANSLSGFNSVNPNGAWTLYFADTIAGGGNATLNGWSLDVTAVPEPVDLTLGILGTLWLGRTVCRWQRRNYHLS